jgi:hypothetical protein
LAPSILLAEESPWPRKLSAGFSELRSPPAVYICAHRIFKNNRVARIAGDHDRLFSRPFVIWSSQLIKDGLIIFLLVIVMIAVLKLQEKFSYQWLVILILSMFGIMSLRFYIFYMVAIAWSAAFIIGLSNNPELCSGGRPLLILLGLGLTYLGVLRTATSGLEQFGALKEFNAADRISLYGPNQASARVLTYPQQRGAISAVPVGFAYLMFRSIPMASHEAYDRLWRCRK